MVSGVELCAPNILKAFGTQIPQMNFKKYELRLDHTETYGITGLSKIQFAKLIFSIILRHLRSSPHVLERRFTLIIFEINYADSFILIH